MLFFSKITKQEIFRKTQKHFLLVNDMPAFLSTFLFNARREKIHNHILFKRSHFFFSTFTFKYTDVCTIMHRNLKLPTVSQTNFLFFSFEKVIVNLKG